MISNLKTVVDNFFQKSIIIQPNKNNIKKILDKIIHN